MMAGLIDATRDTTRKTDDGTDHRIDRGAVCVKTLRTPIGDVMLAAGEAAVAALVWTREELARIGLREAAPGATCALLEDAEAQIEEYFRGRRNRFDLPLDLRGTDFQLQVWNALREIPYGETWSYRELARQVGRPAAVRAVGSANGRNPACILVPCHRVVRSSGELGGYAGGLDRKTFLLDLERRKR